MADTVQINMEQTVETKVPQQISSGTWIIIIITALFFDTTGALFNLIPVAGQVIAIGNDMFADATFWLWFKLKGANYSKTTLFGTMVLKFIPFLDVLPEYTLAMLLLYFQAKKNAVVAQVPGADLIAQKKQLAMLAQQRSQGATNQQNKDTTQYNRPQTKNIPNTQSKPSEKEHETAHTGPAEVVEMQKRKTPEEMRRDLDAEKRKRQDLGELHESIVGMIDDDKQKAS